MEIDETEFSALTAKITRDTTFRCASYKDQCLRRRIAVRMRAHGVTAFGDYSCILDNDSSEYQKLIDALTINVTKFFRSYSTFESLQNTTIPPLWAKPGPIRVWCAGCASGEEAFSLAILFHRHAHVSNQVSELQRVEIIASDIDRDSIASAKRAVYPQSAFADTPDSFIEQYFPEVEGGRTVLASVQKMVHFERRDILLHPPPLPTFDLIVCRNVIIYFDRIAQEELFMKFHHSISESGFLVLGRVETLLGKPRSLFNAIDLRERIFQKRDQ